MKMQKQDKPSRSWRKLLIKKLSGGVAQHYPKERVYGLIELNVIGEGDFSSRLK